MDKPGKWEDYFHMVEFTYNNNFQDSAGLSLFEILYGRKCNTPISWSIPIDRLRFGHEIWKDMELIVKHVQHNLKVSQYRKKSYADLKMIPQELQVGNHVYVKVNPRKSSLRLGKY